MKATVRNFPIVNPRWRDASTLLIILSFLAICVLIFSCSKKQVPAVAPFDGGVSGGTGVGGAGGACNATVADVASLAIFPADNAWRTDISAAPVDANSSQILNAYSNAGVKADFGSGLYDGGIIGIPFTVVCGSQPKVGVTFRANSYDGNYGSESDPGPYPIPLNAPIEPGDGHVLVVDKDNLLLYELYNASVNGNHWEASSGAVFNFASDVLRPDGWTSADAAGLPIFPGLVRYDEMLTGKISHAIRFTLAKSHTVAAHIAPARHEGNGTGSAGSALPFGARIRLKASFDISTYPAHLQVILTAMKKYGLILADIGSDMYITGAPDERWDNDELQQLGKVKASAFEVVK